MNKWQKQIWQRHQSPSIYLNKHLSNLLRVLQKGFGTALFLGLSIGISAIAEPLIYGDRQSAIAQPSQLQDFVTRVTFGEDRITRYAAAVNAIDDKRQEIFRTAKSNPSWSSVAELADSQKIQVCDLTQPPTFLQDLCNQLRKFSEQEIRRHGFTIKEFNQITREQRQDANLRALIQSKQLQLQGKKN